MKKDKQKVLGEVFDDARVKTFLNFQAPEGVDPDFHVLEKAYRGMNIDNFVTFLGFFLDDGRNINAQDSDGLTLLAQAKVHRHGAPYAEALVANGAV
jgi:hypothetical protein